MEMAMINRARIIRRTGQSKTDRLANLLGSAATSTPLDIIQKRELAASRKRKLAARSRAAGHGDGAGHGGHGAGDGDHGASSLDLIRKRPLAARLGVSPWTVDNWRKSNPDFPPPI